MQRTTHTLYLDYSPSGVSSQHNFELSTDSSPQERTVSFAAADSVDRELAAVTSTTVEFRRQTSARALHVPERTSDQVPVKSASAKVCAIRSLLALSEPAD